MQERHRITVQGIVQGVGFRPFVYGQALRHGLAGWVLNDGAGVTIEVEGERVGLEALEQTLRTGPPLARVDLVAVEVMPPRGDTAFVIAHSTESSTRNTLIAPDTATCPECSRELWDPADRRYRYPFINCTNCGPRFTIVEDVPYDREKTTMRAFAMCDECRSEYTDPLDRRFHAQPNACPRCGPRVHLEDPTGITIMCRDPLIRAAELLAAGAILAIKGLGGYHLACDALNPVAVTTLRARKRREAKPFALMAPDLRTANELCVIDGDEVGLLTSQRRPIVLLRQRGAGLVASGVAPGAATLGIMLPYTPLHEVLLGAFAVAVGHGRPAVLVMTSGNVSDEPIAFRDADARQRLAPLSDALLIHDRQIHMRCDDSVARSAAGGTQLLRRSRGYAPAPLALPEAAPVPVLACGSHLKNTFCLVKESQGFVSHHVGDLENLETLTSFTEGIAHFARLFDILPGAVAYDLHPEYLATKAALDWDVPRKFGVQHHHAHVASVIAEHKLNGPVIGVACDGSGYGSDGAVWGCELMVADLCDFERLGHLAYVPLVGGERAVREPWRMAAVYLQHTFGDAFLDLPIPFVEHLDRKRWRPLAQMAAHGINSLPTSSCGRLFDAVAALLGIRHTVVYEGQAAIELETLAERTDQAYPWSVLDDSPRQWDVRPLVDAIVTDLAKGVPTPCIAGRFHRTIAELLASGCKEARERTGLTDVALSGGVFQNRLLLEHCVELLRALDFEVYLNRQVPPNDGGISFGQAAVAVARIRRELVVER